MAAFKTTFTGCGSLVLGSTIGRILLYLANFATLNLALIARSSLLFYLRNKLKYLIYFLSVYFSLNKEPFLKGSITLKSNVAGTPS